MESLLPPGRDFIFKLHHSDVINEAVYFGWKLAYQGESIVAYLTYVIPYGLHLTLLYKPSQLAKRMTSLWWGLKIKSLPVGNSDSTNSLNPWRKIFYYQTSWKNVIKVVQNLSCLCQVHVRLPDYESHIRYI